MNNWPGNKSTASIALVCDLEGRICQVVWDEHGLMQNIEPQQTLVRLVDRVSVRKALDFLLALKQEGSVFDWELNVPIHGKIITLHFAGMRDGDSLYIMGADTANKIHDLYNDLLQMQNESIISLRSALKGLAEPRSIDTNYELFNELSRVNNDLVNAQRELAHKNNQLDRLNQLKNQFLGMAAHDLRGPLTHIFSASEYLLEVTGDKLDGVEKEFLEVIHSSSKRMAELVNDLLDVSIIEAGKLELRLEPTDLGELLRSNVETNRSLAAAKGIAVSLTLDTELPLLLLDRNKMEQVLNNLISNAVKYSLPGSTTHLSVQREAGDIVMMVQDEGQGIAPDQLQKLFQPFGKAGSRPTGGEKSVGLGLMIVKRIVTGHNGRIHVESQVGQGSTFYITLPISQS